MDSNVGDGAKKLGERLVAEVEVEDLSSVGGSLNSKTAITTNVNIVFQVIERIAIPGRRRVSSIPEVVVMHESCPSPLLLYI
jgi:hypothetical protein